jgi:hypothetical protein
MQAAFGTGNKCVLQRLSLCTLIDVSLGFWDWLGSLVLFKRVLGEALSRKRRIIRYNSSSHDAAGVMWF